MSRQLDRPPPRTFALVPTAVLLIAFLNLSIPYYSLSPGPAADVKSLIEVEGATTYPSEGQFLYTTVTLASVRIGDAIRGAVDPVIEVVPRVDILGPDRTGEQLREANARLMESSKKAAAAAALRYLNLPVTITGKGARVADILDGAPAQGVLEVGDTIVAANRRAVSTTQDLLATMASVPVGEDVTLEVRRGEETVAVEVRTFAAPDDPDRAVMGVQVFTDDERVDFPFAVEIKLESVGGPSAGLMFALAVVDLLDGADDLAGGRLVAGTGVIYPNGDVDDVGGVKQKVAGAERAGASVFLVPARELEEARSAARTMTVVGVETLADAVKALREMSGPVSASGGRPSS